MNPMGFDFQLEPASHPGTSRRLESLRHSGESRNPALARIPEKLDSGVRRNVGVRASVGKGQAPTVQMLFLALTFALLAACATAPGLPETTYYRLPEPAAMERLPEPAVSLPIVVEPFSADGLYSDQALIYTLDADASRLRTYHYQLWIDPPVRLLQRRLITTLRGAGVGRIVTDRLPAQMESLRVTGRIARLERVRTGAGWDVAATLVLRAEPSGGGRPWVIGEYHRQLPAQGDTVGDAVRTFGQALDQLSAEFVADLVERARDHAGAPDTPRIR